MSSVPSEIRQPTSSIYSSHNHPRPTALLILSCTCIRFASFARTSASKRRSSSSLPPIDRASARREATALKFFLSTQRKHPKVNTIIKIHPLHPVQRPTLQPEPPQYLFQPRFHGRTRLGFRHPNTRSAGSSSSRSVGLIAVACRHKPEMTRV